MKKIFLLLFCLVLNFSLLAEAEEVIVMIDTSSSMEPYFDNLLDYLFANILNNYLIPGDRFHLLCFSGNPSVELAETMENEYSSLRIQGRIESLKGRLIFGRYTDLLAALDLLITYTEGLKTKNSKRILLLSDGIHDPPPDSPYAGISLQVAREKIQDYVERMIDRNGWSIRILKMPRDTRPGGTDTPRPGETDNSRSGETDTFRPGGTDTSRPGETDTSRPGVTDTSRPGETDTSRPGGTDTSRPGGTDTSRPGETDTSQLPGKDGQQEPPTGIDLFDDLVRGIDVEVVDYNQIANDDLTNQSLGYPRLFFPNDLGRQRKALTVPFVIQNYLNRDIVIRLNRMEDAKGRSLTAKLHTVRVRADALAQLRVKMQVPDDIPYGACELAVRLYFDDNNRVSPAEGVLRFTFVPPLLSQLSQYIIENIITLGIILLAVITLIFLFILVIKQLQAATLSDYFKPPRWQKRRGLPYKDSTDLIEMRVAMQNSHIGFRNIHKVEENTRFSIGGKHSPFLIFLVPFPANIAEIVKKKEEYILIPKKMEFFSELHTSLHDCLNKPVKVISDKGFETTITFVKYISPLDELNRLLHSINYME